MTTRANPATLPETRAVPREAPAPAPGDGLVCKRCGALVTTEAARIVRRDHHRHTRINPHGYVFELGCFSDAPGARESSPPTLEFTWFEGLAWRMADCRGCGAHLGWSYEGGGDHFWGLVLDRLLRS